MTSSNVLSRVARAAGAALLALLPFARTAVAQPAPKPAPAPSASPASAHAPEPEVVPDKGLKGRIFAVAHRDPEALVRILRPLGSGARGAVLSAESGSRTISARDFPENLAALEEAVKRLDVAEPMRADVDLRIHVLLATNQPDGAPTPDDLKDAVAALKGTLLYKSYTPLASFVQRSRDGSRRLAASAVTPRLPGPDGMPSMSIDWQSLELRLEPREGGINVRLDGFSLRAFSPSGGTARIETDLTLRAGEKVVVGTSTLGDRGLVVVVSANVVK